MLMHQSGLIQYAERRSAIDFNRCSISEIKKIKAGKIVPLTIYEMTEAFVVLATGLAVGCNVLIVEVLLGFVHNR